MKLRTIYARFFRSLNYDYIRLSDPRYQPDPWDGTSTSGDFPFVALQLEQDITTVVGGNESGKSQMLDAVAAALTGGGVERSDFCRYSPFFSVDQVMTKPEFGARYTDVTTEDLEKLRTVCELPDSSTISEVAVFHMNETPKVRLFARDATGWLNPVRVERPAGLRSVGVPVPFYIDAEIPLPDSVPLDYLATGKAESALGRQTLRRVWDALSSHLGWFADAATIEKNAPAIAEATGERRELSQSDLKQLRLASDLLIRIAGLGPDLFAELQTAVRTKNGYANSIVDTINAELAKSLNFPNWWSQDSRFELFVSLYEYDLVFMIRDRTGRSYGFDERSDGLKYFLSYFVQYLAHDPPESGEGEILLMDEPDRFLSSSGQQDLLKIFKEFASPRDPDRDAVQVVYVTHSPFLIDKNHSERIRVLEKGEFDEGTRIVDSVAQNHYEPLRSAFGSFVGETTFIGTCNLMLEGASDQILIAGFSSWLGRRGIADLQRLDLNQITLVPAGGVGQIPYLVYLARGRDVEKPAVIVLLDGDQAGNDARAEIRRGGARRKQLVPDEAVLQLTDSALDGLQVENPGGPLTIEDLIPLDIAAEAVTLYCQELAPDVKLSPTSLNASGVWGTKTKARQEKPAGLAKRLERVVQTAGSESFELSKVGYARCVLRVVEDRPEADGSVSVLGENFALLLSELGRRQRRVMEQQMEDRVSTRINRARDRFMRNHAKAAQKQDVLLLEEEISRQLDTSEEAEGVRAAMRRWHRKYALDDDPAEDLANLEEFIAGLKSLAYLGVREAAGEPGTAEAEPHA